MKEEGKLIKICRDDIRHLEFIYQRMNKIHNENENLDYMIKFNSIIKDLHKINPCEHPCHFIKGEDVDMPECLKCGERLY
jgi:hypothetical protein